MSHSKEPWKAHRNELLSEGNCIGCLTGAKPDIAYADAERAATCVNFCAGIMTEAFQLMVQSGYPVLSAICKENQRLREAKKRAWIPVDERRPSSGGTYLTWDTHGTPKALENYFSAGFFEQNDSTVTHWMEMPPGPK